MSKYVEVSESRRINGTWYRMSAKTRPDKAEEVKLELKRELDALDLESWRKGNRLSQSDLRYETEKRKRGL